MQDIVVGIDRSETALAAANLAAEMASALGANLHIVTCADRRKSVNMKVGGDQFHTDWLSDARQHLEDVARKLPHDSCTVAVGEGDPAKMLCEEAERLDARIIVVGNRRVQGVSRVLGSVANEVLRNAPCHVFVANTFG
jgi:nucleotide-binding universal stress UspA family protein